MHVQISEVGMLSVNQLAKSAGLKNIMGVVKGLLEKQAISVQEELKQFSAA